jgi:hypothetical protein
MAEALCYKVFSGSISMPNGHPKHKLARTRPSKSSLPCYRTLALKAQTAYFKAANEKKPIAPG